jgi:hypothetical protein
MHRWWQGCQAFRLALRIARFTSSRPATSRNGRPRASASARMTATTSAIRSGFSHSSGPHKSICSALARQAHVGVGSMPNRFKRRESSVPGPWVGGGVGGEMRQIRNAEGVGICTRHTRQALATTSNWQRVLMLVVRTQQGNANYVTHHPLSDYSCCRAVTSRKGCFVNSAELCLRFAISAGAIAQVVQ